MPVSWSLDPARRAAPARPGRDGEDARRRLFQAALTLFAHKGFGNTSTRELAEAAGVNIAAISYYFGDKAGLYRAVFFEPMGMPEDDVSHFDDPSLTLREMLGRFYAGFLEPLRDPATAALCTKLHFREMIEPTGLWQQAMDRIFAPMHEALLKQLCHHLGLARPDAALFRLGSCLVGQGVHLHVGRDCAERLWPGLFDGHAAIDAWSRTLVDAGVAMVESERARRAAPGLDDPLTSS
jgi:AcrR family transcriptional regulator